MRGIFDPKADSALSFKELQEKKDRYGRFDAAKEIPRITENFFGVKPKSFSILEGTENMIDHLIYVATIEIDEKEEEVILRINADSQSNPYIHVEEALFKTWSEKGIASPKIFSATTREQSGLEYDVMVMQRVGTMNLEEHLSKHPEQAAEWAKKSGMFLASIHQVEAPGFGHLDSSAAKEGHLEGLEPTWKDAVLTRTTETLEFLVTEGFLSEEEKKQIEELLDEYKDLLNIEKGVTLHGDFHNANIVIDDKKNEIASAVDLSQTKIGDPIFDLAFYATYYDGDNLEAFLNGYFGGTHRPADFDKKMVLYDLRIQMSKAKLRKRFGYDAKIQRAIERIHYDIKQLQQGI